MSAIQTYIVEAGLPTLDEARRLVIEEIKRAKREGVKVLKVIHGYGSSGKQPDNHHNVELPDPVLEFCLRLAEGFKVTADPNQVPGPLPDSAPAQNPAPCEVEGEYWRWCPRCGHELQNEKCNLRCPRCHYFLSCSDFD